MEETPPDQPTMSLRINRPFLPRLSNLRVPLRGSLLGHHPETTSSSGCPFVCLAFSWQRRIVHAPAMGTRAPAAPRAPSPIPAPRPCGKAAFAIPSRWIPATTTAQAPVAPTQPPGPGTTVTGPSPMPGMFQPVTTGGAPQESAYDQRQRFGAIRRLSPCCLVRYSSKPWPPASSPRRRSTG
jgi:hypothetical protein